MDLLLQMQKQKCTPSNTMGKNKKDMLPQIGNYNYPATEPKGMEYCNPIDKEFKIAVTKKFRELQKKIRKHSMTSGIKFTNGTSLRRRPKL